MRHRAPRPGADATELLDQVAHGDLDAFEHLHRDIAAMVERVTARVVGDRSIASEVAQEVMLEIWIKAPLRDPERQPPLAWVATIAHRRAIDRVRSEQAESDRRRREAYRTATGDRGDPTADTATEHIEWQQIHAALDALSPRQHEVIELAFYQGHTYREVAAILGIPLGTVKTRVRDALIRLRRHLADQPRNHPA
ncbi:MAG TPA: sigma-70 family RNA polymerase sigma factor [Iamia sp.]